MFIVSPSVLAADFAKLGDELNLNVLIERYDLILPDTLDRALTDEARQIPLTQLLSSDGIEIIVSALYIGDIEGYQCLNADGERGDPTDPDSIWFNPTTGENVEGLDHIVADFSLGDILHGQVTSENLLEELTIANLLGYTLGEDGKYYQNGTKVTGILGIFADCTIFNISDKIDVTEIGHLIGYEYDEGSSHWVDENGNEVHGFMNAVSSRNINNLGTVMDDLTIGDIIPEEDRQKGLISIIPADTGFANINTAVNDAVMDTPLQFFIDQELVSFSETEDKLDLASKLAYQGGKTDMMTIFKPTDADFEENAKFFSEHWEVVKDSYGNVKEYRIPTWRTKPLSESFDFIIGIMSMS